MADSSSVDGLQSSLLQRQAIEKARSSFSRLPRGDSTFQQCVDQADSIPDVVKSIIQTSRAYKERQSTRILRKVEHHAKFLQNASDVVEIVVQTQTGIGCPLWAPVNFVLKVSKDHVQAIEQVLNLIEVISENHHRFELYEKLPPDPILQVALLNIFTDVVEFSVRAFQLFKGSTRARMARMFLRPFKEEFGDIFDRLKRRTEVVDLTAMATQMLRAEKSRKEAQKFRCQRWLEPPNVEEFHQLQVHTKLPGTCDWIKENPAFVKWNGPSLRSVSSRLLCISGTHGCGKTILASSIIEDLKSKQLQIIFYYFSGKNVHLKNLDGIIRAFLWQFLEGSTDPRSLELLSGLVRKGPPVVTDMIQVLREVTALITTPVYCVIDGVDEYVDESNDTIEKLLRFVLGLLNANANFRVVLLGRQHVLRSHVLEATIGATPETIEIGSDLVKQDISAFIDAEIDSRLNADLLKLPGLRDSVSNMLQEKSNGMFLWVELMIKDLSKSDSSFEIKERLRNPPRSLEDIYRHLFLRLLKRFDKVQLNLAKKLLAFTIISCRPLEVDELQYAYALESGSFEYRERLLLHPTQSILDVCGDFINIKDESVQLIHFSIQEFLTRPKEEWQQSDDREIIGFRVDLEPSHRSLGSACLDYLGICEYGYPLSDTDAFLKLAKDYPFVRYASRYVISHLNQAGPICFAIARKIGDFLRSKNYASWIEYLAMLVLNDGSLAMLEDDFERFMSRLDMGEYKRSLFEDDLRAHMHQELDRRVRMLGNHDPRTEQWQSLLHIIPLNGGVIDDTDHELANQTPQLLLMEESSLSHISNALIHNSILPLHRQIDVLLRLESHLRRVKFLTDPLKILFRIILQKSHAIPVYVLLAVGGFYYRLDKWEDALEVYRVALAKVEAQERPIKFEILGSIGCVFRHQEKYEEAGATFRQCLEWRERVLGEDHKDTLWAVSWLAYIRALQGQYVEAEGLYRRELAARERILGKEHKETVDSAYWLAVTLGEQGNYDQAEKFYRQTLEIRERTLGREHEDTLDNAYWLADTLRAQRKYDQAEKFYRQTLEIRERTLGREHEDTLNSGYWLADTLRAQRKYDQAEKFYRQTLEIQERTSGREHEDTLNNACCLANVLTWQKKFDEAENLYRQTLDMLERTLGREHEDTVDSIKKLGKVLAWQKKYVEAETLYRQMLELWQKTLGREHEHTLWITSQLADTLYELGKDQEAEALYRQTLEGKEKLFGKEHPDTLDSMNDLAEVLDDREEYDAAEEMYLRVIEGRRIVLGMDHPHTLLSLSNLEGMFRAKASSASAMSGSRTAIQAAAKGGHLEVVQYLLNQGAARVDGISALQAALEAGHLRVVQLLLKQITDVHDNFKIHVGETAIRVASKSGHPEIVRFLLDHGINVNEVAARV